MKNVNDETFGDVVGSEAFLAVALGRLKVVPDSEIAAADQAVREERLSRLREDAGLPRRARRFLAEPNQLMKINPDGPRLARLPGQIAWMEKRAALGNKLGQAGGSTIAMIGAKGTGKTVMATALALNVIERRGASVRYRPLLELMMEFEAARKDRSDTSRYELLEELAGVGLLILDECDKGFGTEAEARTVFALLDARHRAERDTLLISHPPEAAFKAWAGPELLDRMNESGGLLTCDWPGMR